MAGTSLISCTCGSLPFFALKSRSQPLISALSEATSAIEGSSDDQSQVVINASRVYLAVFRFHQFLAATTMSRPRESLLSLFDPLHGDVAADDGNLSDDYDSDKENSAPPAADMTMGTFFQSFKTSVPPQPKALNKRLVDIGDITVEEPSLVSVSEDDEDEAEFDDENNFFNLALAEQTPRPRPPPAVSAPPRPSPRTPFGELQVGPDATPVSSRRTVERQLFPRNGLTISPNKSSDGPLSSLVDSINAEGVSFSQLGLAKPRVPEITVSSPIATPFTAEFALSPRTTTRDDSLQSSLGANSSPRSNRLSLDLQASFQLHFDSPEDSFDLLNDKISFLGQTSRDHGSVSGDEDDYRLGLDTSEQPATSAGRSFSKPQNRGSASTKNFSRCCGRLFFSIHARREVMLSRIV